MTAKAVGWESQARQRVHRRRASDLDEAALKVLEAERELDGLLHMKSGEAASAEISWLLEILEGRIVEDTIPDRDRHQLRDRIKRLGGLRLEFDALGKRAQARWEGKGPPPGKVSNEDIMADIDRKRRERQNRNGGHDGEKEM